MRLKICLKYDSKNETKNMTLTWGRSGNFRRKHSCSKLLINVKHNLISIFIFYNDLKKNTTIKISTFPFVDKNLSLHKKWSFPLRISLVNVTKPQFLCSLWLKNHTLYNLDPLHILLFLNFIDSYFFFFSSIKGIKKPVQQKLEKKTTEAVVLGYSSK